jgi:thymidylate synthase
MLEEVLYEGEDRPDRTNTGTRQVFGYTIYYDIKEWFPLFTAKKIDFKNIASELLWFLSGSTDVTKLAALKNNAKPDAKTIWHDNAYADYWSPRARYEGDVGRIYGEQWRNWNGYIDQVKDLEHNIQANPYSRRHILQSYSPEQVHFASIPACHMSAQFNVTTKGYLDCFFYMRSNDLLLGHPYNVASYALLTYMLAHTCGYKPGTLSYHGADCHIYHNHFDAVKQYLNSPINEIRPTLEIIGKYKSITDFNMDSFKIHNYHPGSAISAPMAV